MKQENWLDRQMREAENDPVEQGIKKMYADMVKVTEPKGVISVGDVLEFGSGVVGRGLVEKVVSQGNMGSTETLPIRTDNASDCNIFIIKIPEEKKIRYNMVHVWAGDLDLNRGGARREDIAKDAHNQGVAIGITGGRSVSIIPTAREFKYEGITTIKHIHVPSGNRYVSAVYRPATNEVLIRVGADTDATEVWVYDGF